MSPYTIFEKNNMDNFLHYYELYFQVENYSYVICPDCGKEFKIFGESGLDKLAEELDLPILGRMPIDPKLAELASGEFAKANNEYLAAAESLLIALEG